MVQDPRICVEQTVVLLVFNIEMLEALGRTMAQLPSEGAKFGFDSNIGGEVWGSPGFSWQMTALLLSIHYPVSFQHLFPELVKHQEHGDGTKGKEEG